MRPERIIDSHLHLWEPSRFGYEWMVDCPPLQKSFGMNELSLATESVPCREFIFVEAGCHVFQAVEEVAWVSSLAAQGMKLRAVVAQAPLEEGRAVRNHLSILSRNSLVKGVRRNLQMEKDPDFFRDPFLVEGLEILSAFGFSFDVCVVWEQLPWLEELVRKCPGVRFVLDHLGKPDIRKGRFDPWADSLARLALLPNISCKISGLVTEANHGSWNARDLVPYVEHAIACFGGKRILFGSDWPVCTLAASYSRWLETVMELVSQMSEPEKDDFFHGNASRFYRLTEFNVQPVS